MSGVRRVLITGGAGFIGSHVAEYFAGLDGVEVVVLDNLRSGFERNLDGLGVQFVKASILDRDVVFETAKGADFIFHLAAMVSVPESMDKPAECVEVNVQGTLNVLDAARAAGVRKVVLSSTAAIYGDDPAPSKREDMVPAPLSPYAITKLDGEYYLRMYSREHGLGTVSLRYFNVFGPRQNLKSQYAAVVPIFIQRALGNKNLTIYGDGEQTRDFIYVKDVVAANVLAASTPAMEGAYNVARGGKMTVNELAQTIITELKSTSKVDYEKERAGDIKHSVADVSRITACGFAPKVPLDVGLQHTIEYFTQRVGA